MLQGVQQNALIQLTSIYFMLGRSHLVPVMVWVELCFNTSRMVGTSLIWSSQVPRVHQYAELGETTDGHDVCFEQCCMLNQT